MGTDAEDPGGDEVSAMKQAVEAQIKRYRTPQSVRVLADHLSVGENSVRRALADLVSEKKVGVIRDGTPFYFFWRGKR